MFKSSLILTLDLYGTWRIKTFMGKKRKKEREKERKLETSPWMNSERVTFFGLTFDRNKKTSKNYITFDRNKKHRKILSHLIETT
jgi:hypothetical protein